MTVVGNNFLEAAIKRRWWTRRLRLGRRRGGSSREAAGANKLTPRPLFNLTLHLHLMPGG